MGKTLWIVCAEKKIVSSTPRQRQQQQQQQQQRTTSSVVASAAAAAAAAAERRRKTGSNEGEGRWVCNVCGKVYSRGDSLAHHRSIHRGDTICPICQAVFTRKYTMRCHMVNIHGIK